MEPTLAYRVKNPELLVRTGSHLYGTNREGSDIDLRGICIPPPEYLVSLNKNFECYEDPEVDTKIHSIKKAMNMLLDGDPQMTELLFAPESNVERCTSIGEMFLEHGPSLLSMSIKKRLTGFAYSEWSKARALQCVMEAIPKDHQNLRTDLVSYMRERGADKASTDDVLQLFDSVRGRTYVKSTGNLGAKRKADVERYGYCVSSASHACRLLSQLTELMLTGRIQFPRPDAAFLRDIRSGKVQVGEVEKYYDSLLMDVESAALKTVLPEKPDRERAETLYRQMVWGTLR